MLLRYGPSSYPHHRVTHLGGEEMTIEEKEVIFLKREEADYAYAVCSELYNAQLQSHKIASLHTLYTYIVLNHAYLLPL